MVRILFPTIVVVLPIFGLMGALRLYLWRYKRRNLRSPLTRSLLRPPGQSLREQIEQKQDTLYAGLTAFASIPAIFFASLSMNAYFNHNTIKPVAVVIVIMIMVCFLTFYTVNIVKAFSERRNNSDFLKQAQSQAVWLSKWLSSAVGERIHVEPILTIPGWYITRTTADGLAVRNPKEIREFVLKRNRNILPKAMINRVIHQIDQRCRNIDPSGG
jgi:hypothetical protein